MEKLGAFFLLVATLLLSLSLTGGVRRYAMVRLLDIPNARSSHAMATPRGGGLAVVLSFAVAVGSAFGAQWIGLEQMLALAGGLLVAAVGFWDDHGHLSARWRIVAHLAAATWVLYWMGGFGTIVLNGQAMTLGWLGHVLAVIFVVWMLNLFNFMDGIDGIAGAETAFVAAAGAFLLLLGKEAGMHALLLWALVSAVTGFLIWNWPPAKIFMGDVGSGFVGFTLGTMALMTAAANELSLVVWMILAGVFLVDATFTLSRRVLTRQRWYAAHRSHAYQHAAVLLASHKAVTLAVLMINGFWLLPLALMAYRWPRFDLWLLLVAYVPLLWLAFRLEAGKTNVSGAGS